MGNKSNNNGWIKLYRKFTKWEWYTDSYAVHLFLHLLFSANIEDRKWRGILVKRGQLVTGRRILSEEIGVPEITIRRKMKLLEEAGVIDVKTTNKGSIITICNYNNYQSCEPTSEPTSEPLNKNIRKKEYKKENSSPSSTARTCEEEVNSNSEFLENDFYQELKANQSVKERSCMNLHITMEQYDKLLDEFASECTIKQTYHDRGRRDYYSHAFDWMRKHLQIQREQEEREKVRSNGYNERKLSPKEQFLRDYERNEEEYMRTEGARVANTLRMYDENPGGDFF